MPCLFLGLCVPRRLTSNDTSNNLATNIEIGGLGAQYFVAFEHDDGHARGLVRIFFASFYFVAQIPKTDAVNCHLRTAEMDIFFEHLGGSLYGKSAPGC